MMNDHESSMNDHDDDLDSDPVYPSSSWAYATQSVYAEEYNHHSSNVDDEGGIVGEMAGENPWRLQQQQRDEEVRFWQQQYELLLSSNTLSSSLLLSQPPTFHPLSSVQENPLWLESDVEYKNEGDELNLPPQNDAVPFEYSPDILTRSTPYISAFQATLLHETSTVRQALKEYDERIQQQQQQQQQQNTTSTSIHNSNRVGYGHKERILGCDISLDDKYMATASQDSTIRIWNLQTHKCIHTIHDHNAQYECLRVTWTDTDHWGDSHTKEDLLLSTSLDHHDTSNAVPAFMYLLATGGADGIVHIYGCTNPEDATGGWKRYTSLDHSTYNHIVQKKKLDMDQKKKNETSPSIATIAEGDENESDDDVDENDKAKGAVHEIDYTPQIYSLQFINHWDALPGAADTPTTATPQKKNSFLLTSSEDYIHIWEMLILIQSSDDEHERQATSTYLPKKIKQGTKNSRDTVNIPESINCETLRKTNVVIQFQEVMSIHFGPMNGPADGVQIGTVTDMSSDHIPSRPHVQSCPNYNETFTFGGERNPDHVIYVFDASYCVTNGILGVALSDGSLRLMNGRGVCLSVLQLPGQQSHLTSFHWDTTGQRLATTVATGHVVIWDIEIINPLGVVGYNDPEYSHSLVSSGIRTSCRAILDGGHMIGRPLYGCNFIENDQLLISYGSDGRLCLWDSNCMGEVHEPIAILWDNNYNTITSAAAEGYPIFALSVTASSHPMHQNAVQKGSVDAVVDDKHGSGNIPNAVGGTTTMSTIVIAGGSSSPSGILGVPIYLQDVYFIR